MIRDVAKVLPFKTLATEGFDALLYIFLKDSNQGTLIPIPIDVYPVTMDSVVQPDLIVVLNHN